MMNHYIEIALRVFSQVSNQFLLSVRSLFQNIDLLGLLKAYRKQLIILISILGIAVLLLLLAKPYLEISQTPIALKIAQSNHLKSLIIESKSFKNDGQSITTFDHQELESFKKILISKGMSVGHLSMNTSTDTSIEMQLKSVSFASFIDVLNESREIWHLYPLDVSVEATDSAGVVHIKATLKQFKSNQSLSSSVSQN